MKKNKKAQMSIYGIIMIVIGLLVLSALFPVIKEATSIASSNATTTMEHLILDNIPIIIVLAFIAGIFLYVSVQRPQQYM